MTTTDVWHVILPTSERKKNMAGTTESELKYTSLTLSGVEEGAIPKTVCVGCPNAIWHMARDGKKENLRIFCRLMHALIDTLMAECDGRMLLPAQEEAPAKNAS